VRLRAQLHGGKVRVAQGWGDGDIPTIEVTTFVARGARLEEPSENLSVAVPSRALHRLDDTSGSADSADTRTSSAPGADVHVAATTPNPSSSSGFAARAIPSSHSVSVPSSAYAGGYEMAHIRRSMRSFSSKQMTMVAPYPRN
jgi:hypothetical protein